MTALVVALTLLAAYLVGAIPFGYVVARARGVNIFEHGSGNIGATNVGRVLGRDWGILVFVLDLAKGALPALAAWWVSREFQLALPAYSLPVGAGLAAFLGHLFPVYLGFRGGKGVATAAGVVLVLLPLEAAGALFVWLGVVIASRYVSLASVAAAGALCVVRLLATPDPFGDKDAVLTGFCMVAAVLVVARHSSNLVRLLRGSENRLKETPAMLMLAKVVHVLALGLWFGMAVFFSFVVAFGLFGTFESLASLSAGDRPLWFPLPAEYAGAAKEQGSRAAGAAISPLFGWYFLLQGVCGFLTVTTALAWSRAEPADRVHQARAAVLTLALLTVVMGWPVERKVHELRVERNRTADLLLLAGDAAPESARAQAAEMRAAFGKWHGYSTLLNLGTVLFVTIGMALAARLPGAAAFGSPLNGGKQP